MPQVTFSPLARAATLSASLAERDADIAALRDLINNLKNPDNYFGGPAPTAAVTVAELPAAAAPGIVTAPTRNGQPL